MGLIHSGSLEQSNLSSAQMEDLITWSHRGINRIVES